MDGMDEMDCFGLRCWYCGTEGHQDDPCPRRVADAERFGEMWAQRLAEMGEIGEQKEAKEAKVLGGRGAE